MDQMLNIKSRAPQRAVTLTDAAVAKVRELVAGEGDPNLALRVAVRPGGCSGFSYEMYFDSASDVRVFVDAQSLEHVKGSTLDFKDGLMGAGFAIDNPNVTKSCGCGSSFS